MSQAVLAMRQRAQEVWDQIIPLDMPCALVDFPSHSNVGDSAIWLGEVAHLAARGQQIAYAASLFSFSEAVLRKAMPRGIILIHGGGNFGSIWPQHQIHREMILERFRDYKVVQLPQSIHFGNDQAAKERVSRLIQAHPDFTLLTRDHPSFQIGQELGARTLLCPDSAFFLAGKLPRPQPEVDVYALKRTDSEKSSSQWPAPPESLKVESGDWLDEEPHWLNKLQSTLECRAHGRFGHWPLFQRVLLETLNAQARRRVARGVAQLAKGRVVATDRLHAHIIASLMGIRNVVLDNNYGKIHGYMDCWGADLADKITDSALVWSTAQHHLNPPAL